MYRASRGAVSVMTGRHSRSNARRNGVRRRGFTLVVVAYRQTSARSCLILDDKSGQRSHPPQSGPPGICRDAMTSRRT